MRRFWDEAARRNAPWYVDTTVDYSEPDLEQFFETGRKIVDEALEGAPVRPTGSQLAVEIGSGLGRNCTALAERFERVIGLDVSSEMVQQASEMVAQPSISFLVGDGVSLRPVDDATADLVLSFTVFQHIPSIPVIEGYLREAGRVLRPGGVFVFQWNSQPGALRWQARRTMLARLQRSGIWGERFGRNAAEFLGSRVPLRRMQAVLESAGLVLKGVRGEGTLFTWAWAERR
jgi:SAM-dependent methyltransferase